MANGISCGFIISINESEKPNMTPCCPQHQSLTHPLLNQTSPNSHFLPSHGHSSPRTPRGYACAPPHCSTYTATAAPPEQTLLVRVQYMSSCMPRPYVKLVTSVRIVCTRPKSWPLCQEATVLDVMQTGANHLQKAAHKVTPASPPGTVIFATISESIRSKRNSQSSKCSTS